jgi:DNA-binding GntR family transcriptional regulator
VSGSGVFGVNILSEDHGDLAERFAAPRRDKFEGLEISEGPSGVPMLREALARLECRVKEEVEGGTHAVFMAEVERAEASQGAPLAYFRGRFGRVEFAEHETAYQELRGQVLGGRFSVDEPLDITSLAGALGCERWHAYHALTKLVDEGLLARDPERGYVIAPIDLDTIEDALDGRGVIELGVAEASVGRADEAELAELRRRMEATLPLVRDGRFVDINGFTTTNTEFHEYLVGLAGSKALTQVYRRLTIPGIMARTLQRSDVADDGLVEDHRQLVQAYERADVAAAKATIELHTERSKRVHRRAYEMEGDQATTSSSDSGG